MAGEVIRDDLEEWLATWYRAALAARPEPYCSDVQTDRVEPDPADPEPFPARLVVFRDDGGDIDEFGVGEIQVGVGVLAGTKEDPTDAKRIAAMVIALAPGLPGLQTGNPITAFRGSNGPYGITEDQPRARQYLTLSLAVAGRAL